MASRVPNLSVSFASSGMLSPYNLGAALALKIHSDVIDNAQWIGGASGGLMVAIVAIIDVEKWPLYIHALLEESVNQRRSSKFMIPDLSKFVKKFNLLLPENIHKKCSGRIHASITIFKSNKNAIINTFKTKQDLEEAVRTSSYIPCFSKGKMPLYNNMYALDGFFSKSIITYDSNTIKVSIFSGNDNIISPKKKTAYSPVLNISNMDVSTEPANTARLCKSLRLLSIECQKDLFKQGYLDGYEYIDTHKHLDQSKSVKFGQSYEQILSVFEEMITKDC